MARLHISVARTGTPDWPRYFIRDNKQRYWTGKWWSRNHRDAVLYHDAREADDEAMVMNDSIEPRLFKATVAISVEHDAPFTIEQLRDLLEHSTVSLILPDEHDLDGVDVEINLDLREMEETE
jgi:hypothetical protein